MEVPIVGDGVILNVCNNEVAMSWVLSNLPYCLIKKKPGNSRDLWRFQFIFEDEPLSFIENY